MLTVKRSCSVFHILVVDALELIYPFLFQINSEFQKQSSASHEFMLNSCTSDLSRTYLIGKSPFPTLDVFVESIATIGNVSGGAFFRKLHLQGNHMNVRNLVSVLFLTSHFFYFYIASTYEVVHTLKTACKFVPAVICLENWL